MDNTEKKMFRKSFMGGFSKEDVNKYIGEMAAKNAEELEALKASLSALEAKNRELSTALAAAEAKGTELSGALSSANTRIEVLSRDSAELSELKVKFSELSRAFEEKKEELEGEEAKNAELDLRISSLSQIADEYAERKAELADIEISARGRAAAIISEAETSAAVTRAELERTLQEKRRQFEEERRALYNETGDTVSALSRLLSAVKTEVDGMDVKILRLTDNVRSGVIALYDAVSSVDGKTGEITERLRRACGDEE